MKHKHSTLYIIIAVLVLACSGAALWAWNLLGAQYEYEKIRVEIPAGSTTADVQRCLTDALGQDFGSKVYRIWSLKDGSPERAHGSYLVEPGTTALTLAKALYNGRQTPVKLTFNNIRTMGELAARVATVMEFDSAAFIQACDSVLPDFGFDRAGYPAAFLPDTYEFYWTAAPQKVVNTLVDTRNKFWNDERRAKAAKLGLTPVQVTTVATIVEEETNKADERPKVARLYLNRLDRKMPLQADPTVKFAVGDFSLRRITGAHLAVESPYNTYKAPGLPPGPIRVAERSAIDAVLDAPQHDYLYMCAKSDFSGYHDFAADYNRHRINAARYHRALNKRGI
ncbi:MAG: endolytic transglycosylase MltG [Muribaculaceae bacterium]|nr:endolytic transglycosylase MltG [Muribaculaceae bacterium]